MRPMLSPLNLSRLVDRLPILESNRDEDESGSGFTEVVQYRCNACMTMHDDEDDARNCCSPDDDMDFCPICGSEAPDVQAAASCCLWKELDEPTRAALARAVEGGMRWSQALKPYLPEHIQARIK